MTSNAIILACWAPADPLLRQLETDPAMVCVADKPMLQRVVERLVGLGCREIDVVHGDRPRSAQDFLGDGTRWGCRIQHHYAADGEQPLQRLGRLVRNADAHYVLAQANTIPLGDIDTDRPCVVYSLDGGEMRWTGWAVLSGKQISALADAVGDAEDLRRLVTDRSGSDCSDSRANEVLVTSCVSTTSVAAALGSLPVLFAHSPGPHGIGRRAQQKDLWIGNRSRIHPAARLHPPVFIGNSVLVEENAEIGPNVIIGDGCVIDAGSRVEESLLLPGTYVGRQLEVRHSLLAGNHLVNFRLGVALRIADRELLRSIHESAPRVGSPWTQRMTALLLWLALAPLEYMFRQRPFQNATPATNSIGTPAGNSPAFRPSPVHFRMTHEDVHDGLAGAWSRHFLSTFLPGLKDAVAGRVALVGLQPRTVREIALLPEYWQRLHRNAPAGLIGEALLLDREGASAEMRFAGDALSAGPLPLSRVLGMLCSYATRVFADVLSRKSGALKSQH